VNVNIHIESFGCRTGPNIVFLGNTPSSPTQAVTGDSDADTASSSSSKKRRKFGARAVTDAPESPTRSMTTMSANVGSSQLNASIETSSELDGALRMSVSLSFLSLFTDKFLLCRPTSSSLLHSQTDAGPSNTTATPDNTLFKEPEPVPSTRAKGKRKAQA
jgi:hypothetical protein